MGESTDAAVEALHGMLDASRSARRGLDATDAVVTAAIERLGAGSSVADLVRASPASEDRQVVQDAIDAIVAARHRFRSAAIAACVEDGMTPREIADAWGISRQRVDQFIQERKKDPPA